MSKKAIKDLKKDTVYIAPKEFQKDLWERLDFRMFAEDSIRNSAEDKMKYSYRDPENVTSLPKD